MKRKFRTIDDENDPFYDTKIFECEEYPKNTKNYYIDNIDCTDVINKLYKTLFDEFYDVLIVLFNDRPAFLMCEMLGGDTIPIVPIFDNQGNIISWDMEYLANPSTKLMILLGKFLHNI